MADIFISYKKADRERVEALARDLQAEGFTVWWDYALESGQDWFERILEEVAIARCLVGVWTRAAVDARGTFIGSGMDGNNYVRVEHERAGRGRIAGALMEAGAVPAVYADMEYSDMTEWREGARDHAGFRKLVARAEKLCTPVFVTRRITLIEAERDDAKAERDAARARGDELAVLVRRKAQEMAIAQEALQAAQRDTEREREAAQAREAEAAKARADAIALEARLRDAAKARASAGSGRRAPAGALVGVALAGLVAGAGGWAVLGPKREPVAEAREPIAEAVPVETVVPPDETDVAVAVPVPAARAVGEIFRDAFTSGTGSGPELVVLPRGLFVMGSPDTEAGRHTDEGPLRTVSIDYTLAVGRYEVTWNEWDACVADGGCESNLEKAPSWGSKGDAGWGKGRRPVINVSWNDAQAYVTWLNRRTGLADRADRYRLLSEAEWEYAARGVTSATAPSTPFYTGATISTDQANYDGNYTYGSGRRGVYREKTVEAGSFAPNPFGLYDMAGNVWEWVEDCYENSYSGKPTGGAAFAKSSCSNRVFRGGSWYVSPRNLRSAYRNGSAPGGRSSSLGFRLTRTLPR